ncbi:MAG: methylase involved in ubiquinone/menaquinone biosynthesis [Acidimicrobiales bacterium]|nr:methylase involved in ubiquinone/menaquinone biosynthesis [Acidimicrobiales bacterium]
MTLSEWATEEHAGRYLGRGPDWPPHRSEGEAVLVAELPDRCERVLDLGCGDGRLLALVLEARPGAAGVGLDVSPTMLEAAQARFAGCDVDIGAWNLADPLPELGTFDAVVSSFAIHHCEHDRKRALYAEVLDRLRPGGLFANLEHVASPTPRLEAWTDPSNRLLDVGTQLGWLRGLGYADVDCYWKWRELALLAGRVPDGAAPD